MADTRRGISIAGKPGDGANGSGHEQETIGIAKTRAAFREKFRKSRGDRQPREIVVRERRMASMTRDQNLDGGLSGQKTFAIGQTSVNEGGVDAHFISSIRQ